VQNPSVFSYFNKNKAVQQIDKKMLRRPKNLKKIKPVISKGSTKLKGAHIFMYFH